MKEALLLHMCKPLNTHTHLIYVPKQRSCHVPKRPPLPLCMYQNNTPVKSCTKTNPLCRSVPKRRVPPPVSARRPRERKGGGESKKVKREQKFKEEKKFQKGGLVKGRGHSIWFRLSRTHNTAKVADSGLTMGKWYGNV